MTENVTDTLIDGTEIEIDEGELDDLMEETTMVDEATIHTSVDAGKMRLQFFDVDGDLLATLIADAPAAYELARQILRGYDTLEGL